MRPSPMEEGVNSAKDAVSRLYGRGGDGILGTLRLSTRGVVPVGFVRPRGLVCGRREGGDASFVRSRGEEMRMALSFGCRAGGRIRRAGRAALLLVLAVGAAGAEPYVEATGGQLVNTG